VRRANFTIRVEFRVSVGPDIIKLLAIRDTSLTLLVTIHQFRFNPEQVIQAHRTCARKLWLIREKYIALISDVADRVTDSKSARIRRDELIEELYLVYENAPETDKVAYEAARKALKVNEEMTFTDKEIDAFLPASLRKQSSQNFG